MAVTVTENNSSGTSVKLIKFAWTSDGDGDATGTTTGYYDGDIIGFVTDPTDGPTADYDITITDSNSIDVLNGAGEDRHTSTTEYVQGTSLGWVSQSKLTITVADAGDTKSGVAYLYIR